MSVLITLYLASTIVLGSSPTKDLQGGLKFSSYEKIKDLRTGVNFTPNEPIEIKGELEISFSMAFWRNHEAYGHIFRIFSSRENNIDHISSPYNSKFDDLNLILGDSLTALSFSFEEIDMTEGKWLDCQLVISKKDGFISLTIAGVERRIDLKINLIDAYILFGKNNVRQFTTSDVPPLNLKEVVIKSDGTKIRYWPLVKHYGTSSFDEILKYEAITENPIWLVEDYFKWMPKQTIKSAARPQIIYDGYHKTYLLTLNMLYQWDLLNNQVEVDTLEEDIRLPQNQASMVSNNDDRIIIYDLDSLTTNEFDLNSKRYLEVNSNFIVPTSHWHVNKLKTQDDQHIFFGGYGHYTYNNDFFIVTDDWSQPKLDKIEPRYLGAMGQNSDPNYLYIFGGYGSKDGSQEHGAKSYHQLFKVDLRDYSVKTIWSSDEELGEYVFSNSLVFSESDSTFYVLRYPRDKSKSKAVLEGFNIYTAEREVFGVSLNLDFLDTDSYVDIFLNEESKDLIAVLMNGSEDDFQTSFYSLKFPPIQISDVQQSKPIAYTRIIIIVVCLTLVAFVLILIRRIRRQEVVKTNDKKTISEVTTVTVQEQPPTVAKAQEIPKSFDERQSAILFLGGFQVLDREGNEISEKFSGTLRTLLTMLLLFSSNKGKGVPSNFIWEAIWGDKSQSSARNNRNVNIKKLRDLLETVGDIEIRNSSDKWIIDLGKDVFFDYQHLLQCIEADLPPSADLVSLIKRGNILPSFELEWTDSHKAELSNRIVAFLIRHSKERADDDDIQNEIADSIFRHDIINQDALFIKVKYFNSRKRFSLAKKSFESYKKEYELLYGEEYDVTFEDILKS